jgi:hypothetical protein
MRYFVMLVSLTLFIALPGRGDDTPDPLPVPVYDQLRQYRFSEDIAIEEDCCGMSMNGLADWELISGTIRLMEPCDGVVTGLIFEGRGQFQTSIPNLVEQDQLDRFSGEAVDGQLDESFTKLVLHTTIPGLVLVFPPVGGWNPHPGIPLGPPGGG